ncbi:MAG: hypothetical protein K2Q25_08835 [Mycobacteriaceae bacterium]|nr:hypothetical protein [Mycobacteriaceae bacterium]
MQQSAPAQLVTVPGRYYCLKWWKLAAVILGGWMAAAPVGLGLFFWWYHSVDKTPAVFLVLVYVVACIVAGLVLAMIEGWPLVSAPLYGYCYGQWTGHCLLGIVPV